MFNTTENTISTPPPILIFVLGAPCSGKSTLCTALALSYELDHFSPGSEMRQLISPDPTGPAALIKPFFTAAEINTHIRSMKANGLALVHSTSKYVFERIFGVGATPGPVRVLIDGFPRDEARCRYFVDMLRESGKWSPCDGGAVVLVLKVEREVAKVRYVQRGREGDEFEKRFREHEKSIGEIVEAMRRNGLLVVEVDVNEEGGVDGMMKRLEGMEDWRGLFGRNGCVSEDEGDFMED